VIVDLTWREVRMAALVAVDCRIHHMARPGVPERWGGTPETGWQREIDGALGEVAVAKAMGAYWYGAETYARAKGDAARLQVRSTQREGGSLIVHPDDPDDAVFVLVVGRPPRFRIPGWLAGGEAKQERWWRTDIPTPAYLVPQAALRSIDELVEVGP
jgi:hypothetical protein